MIRMVAFYKSKTEFLLLKCENGFALHKSKNEHSLHKPEKNCTLMKNSTIFIQFNIQLHKWVIHSRAKEVLNPWYCSLGTRTFSFCNSGFRPLSSFSIAFLVFFFFILFQKLKGRPYIRWRSVRAPNPGITPGLACVCCSQNRLKFHQIPSWNIGS